ASGRSESGRLGPTDALLDRGPRDGAYLQPRPLAAKIFGDTVDPARGRDRGLQFHELPLPGPAGTTGRLLPQLRIPLQQRRTPVHAPRAVPLRRTGKCAVVRSPWVPRRERESRVAVPASGAPEPRATDAPVHGAGGRRTEAHECLVRAGAHPGESPCHAGPHVSDPQIGRPVGAAVSALSPVLLPGTAGGLG